MGYSNIALLIILQSCVAGNGPLQFKILKSIANAYIMGRVRGTEKKETGCGQELASEKMSLKKYLLKVKQYE